MPKKPSRPSHEGEEYDEHNGSVNRDWMTSQHSIRNAESNFFMSNRNTNHVISQPGSTRANAGLGASQHHPHHHHQHQHQNHNNQQQQQPTVNNFLQKSQKSEVRHLPSLPQTNHGPRKAGTIDETPVLRQGSEVFSLYNPDFGQFQKGNMKEFEDELEELNNREDF